MTTQQAMRAADEAPTAEHSEAFERPSRPATAHDSLQRVIAAHRSTVDSSGVKEIVARQREHLATSKLGEELMEAERVFAEARSRILRRREEVAEAAEKERDALRSIRSQAEAALRSLGVSS